jgi:hypothetical protein
MRHSLDWTLFRFNFSLQDISVGVQDMFVEGPPNVLLRVDADRTKVLVSKGDDDIFHCCKFLGGFRLGI